MTATVDQVTPPTHARRSRRQARALAVAAAVGAAMACWVLLVPLLGAQLTVSTGPGAAAVATVGPALVLATSVLASLLGWGLLAVLEARTPRARTIWTATALVALVVSLAGPLTGASTAAGAVALVLLHLSVAAALIPLLRRTTTARS